MKIFNISLFVILLWLGVLPSNAQINSSGHVNTINTIVGHPVYLYSDLSSGELSVASHAETNVQYVWYKYEGGWNQIQSGNSEVLNTPLEEKGYRVVITQEGTIVNEFVCWVFKPEVISADIETTTFTCKVLQQRVVNAVTKQLTYYDLSSGAPATLPYEFTYSWTSVPAGDIEGKTDEAPSIESPFENTNYTVTVSAFGGASTINVSNEINAIAVKADFTLDIQDRNYKNEVQDVESYNCSLPVFLNMTNDSKGTYNDFSWNVYLEGLEEDGISLEKYDPTYDLPDPGKYFVRLTFSNSDCSDFMEKGPITAQEMDIQAPNVFTPDGDNTNEVFYVVYHSVKTFKMTIVNRWGRKVFSTTNPKDGWDGKINGKKAAEGVYFYYIEAEGYNKGEHMELKNALHLIRGK